MAEKKTTTKKIAPKKLSAKTRSQVQSHAVKKVTVEKTTPIQEKPKAFKVRKSYLVLVIIMLVLGACLYYGRGLFVAAVVNGQPISRLSVVNETEKQSGKQALDTLVRNTLILQEAKKQNITVSEKEIDEEIKKIEGTLSKQGQKLDDVLVMQGMKREDLRKLISLDKLVGKIVGKDIKVTDKEIDEYLEKNKEILPQDQSAEALRKTAMERVKQDKLNQKVQTWLEALKNKAKVLYFVQY